MASFVRASLGLNRNTHSNDQDPLYIIRCFHLLQVLSVKKNKIVSVSSHGNIFYVARHDGHIQVYEGNSRLSSFVEKYSRQLGSCKSLDQVEIIPSLGLLVALSDSVISVYSLITYALICEVDAAKNVQLFAVSKDITPSPGHELPQTPLYLAAACKHGIVSVLKWDAKHNRFVRRTELAINETVRNIRFNPTSSLQEYEDLQLFANVITADLPDGGTEEEEEMIKKKLRRERRKELRKLQRRQKSQAQRAQRSLKQNNDYSYGDDGDDFDGDFDDEDDDEDDEDSDSHNSDDGEEMNEIEEPEITLTPSKQLLEARKQFSTPSFFLVTRSAVYQAFVNDSQLKKIQVGVSFDVSPEIAQTQAALYGSQHGQQVISSLPHGLTLITVGCKSFAVNYKGKPVDAAPYMYRDKTESSSSSSQIPQISQLSQLQSGQTQSHTQTQDAAEVDWIFDSLHTADNTTTQKLYNADGSMMNNSVSDINNTMNTSINANNISAGEEVVRRFEYQDDSISNIHGDHDDHNQSLNTSIQVDDGFYKNTESGGNNTRNTKKSSMSTPYSTILPIGYGKKAYISAALNTTHKLEYIPGEFNRNPFTSNLITTSNDWTPYIEFSAPPTSVIYIHPYVLALTNSYIEIKSPYDHSVLQRIATKSLQTHSLIPQISFSQALSHAHYSTHVFVPVPIHIQIETLVRTQEFTAAEELAKQTHPKQWPGGVFERRSKLFEISLLQAYSLFSSGNYEVALMKFQTAKFSPIHVLSLFPDVLPKTFVHSIKHPVQIAPITSQSELHVRALSALIPYILFLRSVLLKALAPAIHTLLSRSDGRSRLAPLASLSSTEGKSGPHGSQHGGQNNQNSLGLDISNTSGNQNHLQSGEDSIHNHNNSFYTLGSVGSMSSGSIFSHGSPFMSGSFLNNYDIGNVIQASSFPSSGYSTTPGSAAGSISLSASTSASSSGVTPLSTLSNLSNRATTPSGNISTADTLSKSSKSDKSSKSSKSSKSVKSSKSNTSSRSTSYTPSQSSRVSANVQASRSSRAFNKSQKQTGFAYIPDSDFDSDMSFDGESDSNSSNYNSQNDDDDDDDEESIDDNDDNIHSNDNNNYFDSENQNKMASNANTRSISMNNVDKVLSSLQSDEVSTKQNLHINIDNNSISCGNTPGTIGTGFTPYEFDSDFDLSGFDSDYAYSDFGTSNPGSYSGTSLTNSGVWLGVEESINTRQAKQTSESANNGSMTPVGSLSRSYRGFNSKNGSRIGSRTASRSTSRVGSRAGSRQTSPILAPLKKNQQNRQNQAQNQGQNHRSSDGSDDLFDDNFHLDDMNDDSIDTFDDFNDFKTTKTNKSSSSSSSGLDLVDINDGNNGNNHSNNSGDNFDDYDDYEDDIYEPTDRDHELLNLLCIVDTILVKTYLVTDPTPIQHFFEQANFCDIVECSTDLRLHERYNDLIALYKNRGYHRNSLQLLQILGTPTDMHLSNIPNEYNISLGLQSLYSTSQSSYGPEAIAAYIYELLSSQCNKGTLQLALEFIKIPLQACPEKALEALLPLRGMESRVTKAATRPGSISNPPNDMYISQKTSPSLSYLSSNPNVNAMSMTPGSDAVVSTSDVTALSNSMLLRPHVCQVIYANIKKYASEETCLSYLRQIIDLGCESSLLHDELIYKYLAVIQKLITERQIELQESGTNIEKYIQQQQIQHQQGSKNNTLDNFYNDPNSSASTSLASRFTPAKLGDKELGEMRYQLLTILRTWDYCNAEKILSKLPAIPMNSSMTRTIMHIDHQNVDTSYLDVKLISLLIPERVELLRKTKNYHEAIKLLLYKLNDLVAAEMFCEQVYSKTGDKSLYSTLLSEYINSSTTKSSASTSTSTSVQQKIALKNNEQYQNSTQTLSPELLAATRLLLRCYDKVDLREALRVLPENTPVALLEPFLRKVLIKSAHTAREAQIQLSLSRVSNMNAKNALLQESSKNIIVDKETVCFYCTKKLGNSAIALTSLPRRHVLHYACFSQYQQDKDLGYYPEN